MSDTISASWYNVFEEWEKKLFVIQIIEHAPY